VFIRSNKGKCFTVWNDGVNAASWTHLLKAHTHCEGDVAIQNQFSIMSKNGGSAFTFDGLDFEEYDNIATTAIFAKDANTASVLMTNEKLNIFEYSTTPALFDTPSAYTITNPVVDFVSPTITGWAPTVSGCTGLGTGGTCALRYGTPAAGVVRLNTGTGSPAGFGNMTLNFGFNLGSNSSQCIWAAITPGDAGGTFWTAPGPGAMQTGYSTTAPVSQWANGGLAALATSAHVDLAYMCKGT
jgi:hypothetical protein